VKQNYYTDVDDEAVMQGAMKGYVAGLDDPYSQYMTSEEYQAYQTEEAGQTVGIGVTVTQTDEGYLQVEEVNADSPAEKAGMQQGDILTKVEGEDLAELGYAGALSKIRGEAGTTVQLTIQRNGDTLELDVERQNIEVTTAEGQMLDGQIGYIRISSFKGNTPEQFQAIYDRLVQDGAKALIFDLRDDGGGLVSALERFWIRCCRRAGSPLPPIGTARPKRWWNQMPQSAACP
ncbi:MAG: S41 family peptidase, partial [Ruminococcus callidus]